MCMTVGEKDAIQIKDLCILTARELRRRIHATLLQMIPSR